MRYPLCFMKCDTHSLFSAKCKHVNQVIKVLTIGKKILLECRDKSRWLVTFHGRFSACNLKWKTESRVCKSNSKCTCTIFLCVKYWIHSFIQNFVFHKLYIKFEPFQYSICIDKTTQQNTAKHGHRHHHKITYSGTCSGGKEFIRPAIKQLTWSL